MKSLWGEAVAQKKDLQKEASVDRLFNIHAPSTEAEAGAVQCAEFDAAHAAIIEQKMSSILVYVAAMRSTVLDPPIEALEADTRIHWDAFLTLFGVTVNVDHTAQPLVAQDSL